MKLTINLEKARQIAHAKRREFRSAEFAPYDDVIAKQIPGQEGAEAARQAIRNKYAALQEQIDAAANVDMLRALLSQNHIDTLRPLQAEVVSASIQLIMPNPNVACTPGMCLVYVQDAFNIPARYPSAVSAWEASEYKHADQDFPKDVWLPIWFASSSDLNGHVALRHPDGTVWSASHPTRKTPIHHASIADLIRYYGGRLSYLGWTKDVEGVLVVE